MWATKDLELEIRIYNLKFNKISQTKSIHYFISEKKKEEICLFNNSSYIIDDN